MSSKEHWESHPTVVVSAYTGVQLKMLLIFSNEFPYGCGSQTMSFYVVQGGLKRMAPYSIKRREFFEFHHSLWDIISSPNKHKYFSQY